MGFSSLPLSPTNGKSNQEPSLGSKDGKLCATNLLTEVDRPIDVSIHQ